MVGVDVWVRASWGIASKLTTGASGGLPWHGGAPATLLRMHRREVSKLTHVPCANAGTRVCRGNHGAQQSLI